MSSSPTRPQQRFGIRACLIALHTPYADRRFHDVFQRRKVGKKIESLEHHANFGPLPGDVLLAVLHQAPSPLMVAYHVAVDVNVAAVDLFQVVDATQESAFSGPRRPNDHDDFILPDVQIDVLERVERSVEFVYLLGLDDDIAVGQTDM